MSSLTAEILGVVVPVAASYRTLERGETPEAKKHLQLYECELCFETFEFNVLTAFDAKETLAKHGPQCEVAQAITSLRKWEQSQRQQESQAGPWADSVSPPISTGEPGEVFSDQFDNGVDYRVHSSTRGLITNKNSGKT